MADGVKETMCTKCSHREVCAFRNDYLKIVEAVNTLHIHSHEGEKAIMTPIANYPFIEDIVVKCRYFTREKHAVL